MLYGIQWFSDEYSYTSVEVHTEETGTECRFGEGINTEKKGFTNGILPSVKVKVPSVKQYLHCLSNTNS